jgi:hypothetical protein
MEDEMEDDLVISEEVASAPADENGNGFVVFGDVWSESIVGDDGNIYIRKNGKITIEPSDEES